MKVVIGLLAALLLVVVALGAYLVGANAGEGEPTVVVREAPTTTECGETKAFMGFC